jgi:hypothetical protein
MRSYLLEGRLWDILLIWVDDEAFNRVSNKALDTDKNICVLYFLFYHKIFE